MGLIEWMMERFRKFNVFDVSVFKTYILLIGALLGAYFASFVKEYVTAIVVIIILALIWIMYRLFKN